MQFTILQIQFSSRNSAIIVLCLLICQTVKTLAVSKQGTTAKSCTNSCQGKTCDYWNTEERLSCEILENEYGCSCDGCNCFVDKMIKACEVVKYAGDGNCDDGNNNPDCLFDGGKYLLACTKTRLSMRSLKSINYQTFLDPPIGSVTCMRHAFRGLLCQELGQGRG